MSGLGLKIGGGLLVLAVLGLVIWLYGNARYAAGKADERTAWQAKVIDGKNDQLAAYQRGVDSVLAADRGYNETIRERVVPITKTIVERATEYAATPDGSTVCLPADRVLVLDQTTSAFFNPAPAATPGGPDGTLPPDPVGHEP